MTLKSTITTMQQLLQTLLKDLSKSERGNKAASQRVRTGSIKFAKIAKLYRKESVASHKEGGKKTAKTKNPKRKVAKKKPVKRVKTKRKTKKTR